MADGTPGLSLTCHGAIAEIPADQWERCGGDDNPFVSHAFLSVLEESGSVGPRTGWLPRHAALRDPGGEIVGVAPTYVKSHSYGEYVFDHAWAQALERVGGDYYPKLQVAVPFSPVPGPRLMMRPGVAAAALGAGLVEVCRALRLSSVHVTFCREAEWQALGEAGWLRRLGMQFHWENRGYADFEAFLGVLSSRKRKAIRKERSAAASGLDLVVLRGPEIGAREWDAFYGFYRATVDRKWGGAYLTRRFFALLGERLGEKVVLMMARQGDQPVAGALNLLGRDALYGRNWGAAGDWPFLHFELCYYQAIEFAIREGVGRVEAGAQGPHKIQRGYLPCPTYSAHWIAHPGLARAVADFVAAEREEMATEIAALAQLSPFRAGGEDG